MVADCAEVALIDALVAAVFDLEALLGTEGVGLAVARVADLALSKNLVAEMLAAQGAST